ncbi:MAG TPA: hypothetical protein VLD85_15370 [Anaeromyxobacteraceae bacterium]|nr:hypothetical protein [Anaeromyxobacteraceae bacterium]
MTQRTSLTMLLGAVAAGLALGACGSAHESPTTVSGVASTDATGVTITVKDASTPAQVVTTMADAEGAFAADVTGLTAPFLVRAQWKGATGSDRLYSMATEAGTANVNPLTDAAMAAASPSGNADDVYASYGGKDGRQTATSFMDVMRQLQTVLAPLFDLYGVANPISDDASRKTSGISALLKDVRITISNGTVTVTNRATGAVIFTGSLANLASGTFYPENMPSGPVAPATCTAFTYSEWSACQADGTQTRTVLTSSPAGCTGGSPVLTQACTYVPPPAGTCTSFTYSAWGACQPDGTQTRTVLTSSPAGCTGGSPMLTQACTYVPPACTYTYSAWSACSMSGTQTRTVLSASPAGCTGTPVLSQTCTPPVTNPVTFSMVVSSCTSCHGLTSNTTVFKSGGFTVTGRSASQWLTTVNNMVGLGTTLAPGTTAQNYADYLANVP